MNVVIDSNLLIVLVNQDPRSEIVRQQFEEWISQEVQMHAPHLALYEIANALTRLIVGGIFPQDRLTSAWAFLNNLPIAYHDISQGTRIVEIALSLRRQSAYDAAYIALAEDLEPQLWTLDGPLYRNAVECGFPVFLLN
ncbi:MAG: type II toxin-antitoxin system VapC family toxin [Microcoleaceae cyanobacterium]